MNEYHLLITPTYNYIYKTESRPRLSFIVMHKVLSSYHMISKSDFMLKIPGTFIDCTFAEDVIKSCSILVSLLRKQ